MDIKGKVAVITGAASGIGAGLAQRFMQEEADGIVVADLHADGASTVAALLGERAVAVRCDVSREADIGNLVRTARERFGRIDIYFSNAGIPPGKGGVGLEDPIWERMWQVHCMAHVWAARAVLPEMVERGEGYFALTASAAGLLNIVESAPYAATKQAAVGLAEWLRIAYGRKGVRVSCLCPQAVVTGMTRDVGAGSAEGDSVITPADVAEAVVQGMRAETFLLLSHPETVRHLQAKAQDTDRWIGGMQKLHAKHGG
jgi:NAD(P)-dependent dehydrogenase (short-subunit alcohol dehydrogenase family)